MSRKKSVKQQLVNPLRKLSLLTSNTHSFRPDLDFVPEQQDVEQEDSHENKDMLTLFPREVILQIFSLLSFQDLIKVQLV